MSYSEYIWSLCFKRSLKEYRSARGGRLLPSEMAEELMHDHMDFLFKQTQEKDCDIINSSRSCNASTERK